MKKIEEFGSYAVILPEVLREFPREMWPYKPDADHWCVHEIILHLLDTELNFYVRYRACAAEPGKTIMPFDQDKWSRALRYVDKDVDDAIGALRWAIRANHELLKSLPEYVFENTVIHPERGTRTLDQLIEVYFGHIPHHIGQMRKRLGEWKKLQKKL